jgi:hypothetical protein
MYAQSYRRNDGFGVAPAAVLAAAPAVSRMISSVFGAKRLTSGVKQSIYNDELAEVQRLAAAGDIAGLQRILSQTNTGRHPWNTANAYSPEARAAAQGAITSFTQTGASIVVDATAPPSTSLLNRVTGALQQSVIRGEIPSSALTSVAETAEQVAARARNAAGISRASMALQSIPPIALYGGLGLLAFLLLRKK